MAMQPLDQQFKGFAQDVSRDQLSKGVMWRMADLIPDLGAPARKRGGWTYQGDVLGSGSYVSGLGYFRKTTGLTEQLVSIDERGTVYVDGVRVGGLTSGVPVKHKPFYFLGNLIIPDGAYAAKRWTGSSLAASKSGFNVGCAWGDFIIWGKTAADATSLSFGTGVASTISGSSWQLPGEIVALSGIPGRMVMIFGYSDTWALFGDNPPPGGNMVQRTLYAGNGIMDQRSLVNTGAYVIWANTTGIYQSSGSEAIPLDMTERGGIGTYWRSLVSDFDLSAGWCAAATRFKNFYIISITDADRNPITTMMCDLNSLRWVELQNISARAFARAPGASASSEEAYFGRTTEARIGKLSSLWTPGTADLGFDADGTAVLPFLETPFYRMAGYGQDRVRNIHTSYILIGSSGAPTCKVGFVTSPDSDDYTFSARELPVQLTQDRKPSDIRRKSRGIGLRLELTAAADDFQLFGLETEGHTLFEKR